MKGSIDKYKTKGSSKPHWRYRIFLGKDAGGKKRYDSKAGFEKQGDAADAMRARMEELQHIAADSCKPPAVRAQTFGEHLHEWLDTHAPQRCQAKALERYRQLARYILVDADGNATALAQTPLKLVTPAQLEQVLYALLKSPAKRKKHLSAKTVRHVAGVVGVALNKAFRLGKIDVNPLLRIELPKVERKDARSLTPAEMEALQTACLNDWTFPFIQVAMATGCRRGELLALEWSDLDFTTGAVLISKSLEQTEAGLRIKRPKNGKTRTFRLPQSAVTALRFQHEQQNEHRRMFGGAYRNLNLVFCEPNGYYLDPALVSQTIVRRFRKAGIGEGSLHTLRHTHASGLLSAGVPLTAVSARLGHSNVNVTASIYAHAMPADDQLAADKWDELTAKKLQ